MNKNLCRTKFHCSHTLKCIKIQRVEQWLYKTWGFFGTDCAEPDCAESEHLWRVTHLIGLLIPPWNKTDQITLMQRSCNRY